MKLLDPNAQYPFRVETAEDVHEFILKLPSAQHRQTWALLVQNPQAMATNAAGVYVYADSMSHLFRDLFRAVLVSVTVTAKSGADAPVVVISPGTRKPDNPKDEEAETETWWRYISQVDPDVVLSVCTAALEGTYLTPEEKKPSA